MGTPGVRQFQSPRHPGQAVRGRGRTDSLCPETPVAPCLRDAGFGRLSALADHRHRPRMQLQQRCHLHPRLPLAVRPHTGRRPADGQRRRQHRQRNAPASALSIPPRCVSSVRRSPPRSQRPERRPATTRATGWRRQLGPSRWPRRGLTCPAELRQWACQIATPSKMRSV